MQKCPICGKYAKLKSDMIDHIEKAHANQIPDEMSTSQFLYYSTTGRENGLCMVCSNETPWNEKTGKPSKLCKDSTCREILRKDAVTNHIESFGVDTLLRDPNYQKDVMLKNKPNAQVYKFADGGEIVYLSKLEHVAIKFCENVLEYDSSKLIECPYQFEYKDGDMTRYYLPDLYDVDNDIIIEVKEGGEKPNTNKLYIKETKYKEALKDEAVRKSGQHHYIKIINNNFAPYIQLLFDLKNDKIGSKSKTKGKYFINESAVSQIEVEKNYDTFPLYLILIHGKYSDHVVSIGLTDIIDCSRLYMVEEGFIIPESIKFSRLKDSRYTILKYTGESGCTEALKFFNGSNIPVPTGLDSTVYLLELLAGFGINVDLAAYDSGINNNTRGLNDFSLMNSLLTPAEVSRLSDTLIDESLSIEALLHKLNAL